MLGNYLRITALEADRAVRDPAWVLAYAGELHRAELGDPGGDGAATAAERLLRTEKAWDALRFLLERAGCPVDVVSGEREFTGDDWGYGPAHLLPADRVQAASDFLNGTTFGAMAAGVTPADLTAAGVYPQIWDEPGAFAWIEGHFKDLVGYFTAAAAAGDAMVVWLD